MADSNEMSNHPDDSPNSTKKRAGISEDEGSAVLINDQSKRLKTEKGTPGVKARNNEIAIEAIQEKCINPRTKQFYVQPVYVVSNGSVETMDLQEYEKEKEKRSASSSPKSVDADLDAALKSDEDIFFSYPNKEMKVMINSVMASSQANQELIEAYEAACLRCEEKEREARRFARKMAREVKRKAEEEKHDGAIVEEMIDKEKGGDVEAMLWLAKWYEKGRHRLDVNKCRAYLYYKKAADLGNSTGQEMAGYMLIKGRGVPTKDIEGGIELLSKSTEGDKGSGVAAFYLGFCYYSGKNGFRHDFDEATKWLTLVRDHKFHRPAKDTEQAKKILNELEERKRLGHLNLRVPFSPSKGSQGPCCASSMSIAPKS